MNTARRGRRNSKRRSSGATVCRVKMLEAQLDRIGPEEFDQLMEQIEAAQAEVYEAGGDVLRLKWKFYS